MAYLDLDNLFSYHPPFGSQAERFVKIRDAARVFAEVVTTNSPSAAEQTLSIRALQESVMWANAGIACNEAPTVAHQ